MYKIIALLALFIAITSSAIEVVNQETYMGIMNGNGVCITVHNTATSTTVSNQPFCVFASTQEALNNLIYSEWNADDMQNAVQRNIDWNVSYDTEADAQAVCNLVMTADSNIQIRPIKHPDRDEWATPFMQSVFDNIPASETKTSLLSLLNASNTAGHKRTKAQMKTDGWF